MAARDMKYNLKPDKNKSMRVIIDCDPGNGIPGANIDDGLALALAIAAPQISLEMITTVAGNTPVEIGLCSSQRFRSTIRCTRFCLPWRRTRAQRRSAALAGKA